MTGRFIEALLAADRRVIMELKPRASDGSDLFGGRSVAELVHRYEEVGAPCLSVVTGRWFGGSAALLLEVAAHTGLPLLQKDFLTNPRQLRDARERGASAVLLTAGLIPGAALLRLVDASLALGLTPFIEVTTDAEVAALPPCDECVVAVNNKDIRQREAGDADIARSMRLLPAVQATGSPAPVSASGIATASVAAGLLDAGYAGLLIGTGLLREQRLERWLDELDAHRQPPAPRAAPGAVTP